MAYSAPNFAAKNTAVRRIGCSSALPASRSAQMCLRKFIDFFKLGSFEISPLAASFVKFPPVWVEFKFDLKFGINFSLRAFKNRLVAKAVNLHAWNGSRILKCAPFKPFPIAAVYGRTHIVKCADEMGKIYLLQYFMHK